MALSLDFITKELIEQAAKEIETKKIKKEQGSGAYIIKINGQSYPLRQIVIIAATINGIKEGYEDFKASQNNRSIIENTGYKCIHIYGDISDIINRLIENLENDTNKTKVHDFKITKLKKKNYFAWITDHKDIIGNGNAHYEIIKVKENIFVDLHFEQNKKSRKLFYESIGDKLPNGIDWFKWSKGKSIRVTGGINIDDPNIIEKLKEKLLLLENSIGDKVREIILENPEIMKSKNNTDPVSELIPGNSKVKQPLNQILFGPPGTGKTYHTINKAIEIINPEFDLTKNRVNVKKEYERLVSEGQIVFTTFHQSMSYEDFVEGIKPETEDGKVTYDVQDGIFKNICTNASAKHSVNFDNAYKEFVKTIDNSENDYYELKTKTGKLFHVSVNRKGNLSLHTTDKKRYSGVMTKEKLRAFMGGETNAFNGWVGYANAVIACLKEKHNLSDATEDNSKKNFVLIIDEINRGNVSAIFGELITLIEEDKRIGGKEELRLVLPYSKNTENKFGVPSNLYILGTMNTADRSVEALDTALRRRFSFINMPPNPSVIKNDGTTSGILNIDTSKIDLIELLTIINKRIEILLDGDHLIGHSYFMGVDNIGGLKLAFSKQIIPLLQEYFYGDYGKISLVLGEGFCTGEKTSDISNVFASSTDYETDVFAEKVIYELKDLNKISDEDFIGSINTLLNKIEKVEDSE